MVDAALSLVCVLCCCNGLSAADPESSQAREPTTLQRDRETPGREWNEALGTHLPIGTEEGLFQFFSQLQPVEAARLHPFGAGCPCQKTGGRV